MIATPYAAHGYGQARKRGLSKQKLCIAVAIDIHKNPVAAVIGHGKPSAKRIKDALQAHVAEGSKSFRAAGESKMAFDTFFDLMHSKGESQLEFCERQGWLQDVQRMMPVDYLIANRDRHGANIEVLRSREGNVRLAPLFDNGVSLVFSCYGDEKRVREFDPLTDVRANNFIGTRSLEENLGFVPPALRVDTLAESGKDMLLAGLDGALSETHMEAIWNIVWQRWLHWRSLCEGRA